MTCAPIESVLSVIGVETAGLNRNKSIGDGCAESSDGEEGADCPVGTDRYLDPEEFRGWIRKNASRVETRWVEHDTPARVVGARIWMGQ